ncbi:MAG: DUF4253 domain-containing protein [Halothece sp. Uz-M2-17]|nr:DUF4253 domain-containing protein [Halothece sp. Uz-M2-17]
MELSAALLKIREAQTDGINYDLTTEDIIKKLEEWNQQCHFSIARVSKDTIDLRFQSLPNDLDAFCQDIYEFCPDVIDQGYDCIPEMIEMAENRGQEVNAEIQDLIADVDLNAEEIGFILLKKDLPKRMQLTLWWD